MKPIDYNINYLEECLNYPRGMHFLLSRQVNCFGWHVSSGQSVGSSLPSKQSGEKSHFHLSGMHLRPSLQRNSSGPVQLSNGKVEVDGATSSSPEARQISCSPMQKSRKMAKIDSRVRNRNIKAVFMFFSWMMSPFVRLLFLPHSTRQVLRKKSCFSCFCSLATRIVFFHIVLFDIDCRSCRRLF